MCIPIIQDFSQFSISDFYDGALAPVLTRYCFKIFVVKSVKDAI